MFFLFQVKKSKKNKKNQDVWAKNNNQNQDGSSSPGKTDSSLITTGDRKFQSSPQKSCWLESPLLLGPLPNLLELFTIWLVQIVQIIRFAHALSNV